MVLLTAPHTCNLTPRGPYDILRGLFLWLAEYRKYVSRSLFAGNIGLSYESCITRPQTLAATNSSGARQCRALWAIPERSKCASRSLLGVLQGSFWVIYFLAYPRSSISSSSQVKCSSCSRLQLSLPKQRKGIFVRSGSNGSGTQTPARRARATSTPYHINHPPEDVAGDSRMLRCVARPALGRACAIAHR